ncbi:MULTISPECIES: tautomerase enzyme [Bradyrhizobium]|uniref:tautomerase enzyme n=1 Tax=Bradyrhizobium TaxID=374 RepID=UPI00155EBAC2|nr:MULTISPECIES: tautomerase enzyme [Bradyrhizobium]MDD1520725.1 tautomerase enzyme [Bradyrhizobium sp. WBAH30]MDD1545776.1 tautomerase enzyme [Bradyrhizobium sp. WBAH41]MDD1558963.1 tautomerase enzyme [Bradyrhizobium sp. WBAH23]MDD1566387.1 tautomerase enzyme [Bradyrhizobium sp. WBAH33]MDD1591980.1 tautomerase enzyme [Bradyrhizobium sp. WBAH42]
MTFIHVMTPQGRLTGQQRRVLAKTLTDAVLVPEVGRLVTQARRGYQVHFLERPLDMMANGGELLSDQPRDVMVVDVVVMDCCWTREDRAAVIRNVLRALADACELKEPPPGWWVNFRIIEEGNWGSRGGVLSFLDILQEGAAAFPPERAAAIRTALAIKNDR